MLEKKEMEHFADWFLSKHQVMCIGHDVGGFVLIFLI